ncbi:MAG: NUDIX hydrolase [Schleiferiaceae bacterium]|nr:NUDIX hydrolase [Schleiferiaceae bacterium]
MPDFTVRVYGILRNANDEVLLSTEVFQGKRFTKFPGGGLEFGEGTIDCLLREFREECDVAISVGQHFYTTDFFVESVFAPGVQVINVYYLVSLMQGQVVPEIGADGQVFEWVPLAKLSQEMMTFPIEKKVVRLLQEQLANF